MNTTDIDLAGKAILITGGSMGIGYACAERCLSAGARVMIAARGAADLSAAARRLAPLGDVVAHVADVSRMEQVEQLFGAAVARFGTLDGVIPAAGVYGPIGRVIDVDPTEWLDAIRINLFGAFLVARQAGKVMVGQSRGGRIVLFSGGGAAAPFPHYTAYACGKIGVVRLTETLAQELAAENVEINCISPGFVVTRLHQDTVAAGERAGGFLEQTQRQLSTGGVPAAVGANAAAFLVADAAKGITGKFVAAPHDTWSAWPYRLDALKDTDIFTLRRILPVDRGMNWQ